MSDRHYAPNTSSWWYDIPLNSTAVEAVKPYGDGAPALLAAGWTDVFPLPRGRKEHPPSGFTGATGRTPTDRDIQDWLTESKGTNVALRLPPDVVGLDVDSYDTKRGSQTLSDLEARLGRLPATWMISNRYNGSGHRLFRVPAGLKWPGVAGPGIDLIRHGHRYCVAPPSLHPEGRMYHWLDPLGQKRWREDDTPAPAHLGELPDAWVAALTGGEVAEILPRVAVKAEAWLIEHGAGEADAAVTRAVERALRAFEDRADSRHDTACTVSFELACLAAEGHPGVADALATVGTEFLRRVTAGFGRRSLAQAEAEWARAVQGALEVAAARPAVPVEVRSHGRLGRVLNRAELAALPPPEPLIAGWLDLRSTVLLIGDTGTNKTFTLLGWACSVATGRPWLGHAVRVEPTPVLLVIGEGGSGLHKRIAAWEASEGVEVPPDNLAVMLQPTSIQEEAYWSELREFAVACGARFVALDTFSSLAPAADETTDAALVVRRMGDLATAIDGTVLLAHHTGWANQNRARGGSQLEANPDSVIVLQKVDPEAPDAPVTVWRKKVKDNEAGRRLTVRRATVAESCVLELVEAGAGVAPTLAGASVEARLLRVLDDADPFTYTFTKLRDSVGGNKDAASSALEKLIDADLLVIEHREAPEGSTGKLVGRERVGRSAVVAAVVENLPDSTTATTATKYGRSAVVAP